MSLCSHWLLLRDDLLLDGDRFGLGLCLCFDLRFGLDIELGLYLPLTNFRNGQYTFDGYKFRIKAIAPHPDGQAWYWGANFEIGQKPE